MLMYFLRAKWFFFLQMAKSKEMYVLFLLSPGPENADLIATLPVGTTDVLFQITKSTQNYLGERSENFVSAL